MTKWEIGAWAVIYLCALGAVCCYVVGLCYAIGLALKSN